MKISLKRMLAALLTGFILIGKIQIPAFAEEVNDAIPAEAAATEPGAEKIIPDGSFLYEQEFLEDGIKVILSAEADVIPDAADISISLIKDGRLDAIEGEIREKMEAVTQERMAASSEESQDIFGRYYDLKPAVSQAYAFDFAITYMDEDGSLCEFEPKEGQAVDVSIEIAGLSDVISDEMCEAELFYNPETSGVRYGSRQAFSNTDGIDETKLLPSDVDADKNTISFSAEHFSVYTAAIIKYAASANQELLAAQQRVWNIMNTYADPEYFLFDSYKESMKKAQYQELKGAAQKAAAGCVTQYDKIKAVTEFVAERTYYDYKYLSDKKKYPTFIEPYQVYKKKRTVCAGYAILVKTLLTSIGIPCMDLHGNNHAYNAAYDSTNKRWIFIDATWCSDNQYTVDDKFVYQGHSTHYFDMTPQQIAELTSHEIYSLDGLLDGVDNSAYYRMETEHDTTLPEDDLIWRKGRWYLSISGTKKSKVKVVSGFADLEVREIMDRAFDENKKLKQIDLSAAKVKSIGYASFYNCRSLNTVKFPRTLKKIDGYAFYGCSKLKEIDLSGTKISNVGYAAFYGCNRAASIYIPSTMKKIGDFAFGCDGTKTVDTFVVTPLSAKKLGCTNTRKYIWGRRKVNRSPFAYQIKFDGNGAQSGEMAEMLCGGGMQYKLSANKFKRAGYKFAGWNTKKNGKGKSYKNKAKIKNLTKKNGKTIKLYAQWKADELN